MHLQKNFILQMFTISGHVHNISCSMCRYNPNLTSKLEAYVDEQVRPAPSLCDLAICLQT